MTLAKIKVCSFSPNKHLRHMRLHMNVRACMRKEIDPTCCSENWKLPLRTLTMMGLVVRASHASVRLRPPRPSAGCWRRYVRTVRLRQSRISVRSSLSCVRHTSSQRQLFTTNALYCIESLGNSFCWQRFEMLKEVSNFFHRTLSSWLLWRAEGCPSDNLFFGCSNFSLPEA